MPIPASAMTSSTSTSNIWVAAGEGDLERVKDLVDNQGISPAVPDSYSYTPLHAAASYSHLQVLRYLLSHTTLPPAGVETVDSDGETCLFVCEDVETARVLVEEFGADVSRKNNDGLTAEQVAKENEREDVATYLRSQRGDSAADDADTDDPSGESRQSAAEDIVEEGDETDPAVQAALDAAIEQRTEAIMEKVGQILGRAEARVAAERAQSGGGADGQNTAVNGDADDTAEVPEYELNEEEEKEMRDVVGEALMRQILEGWGAATNLDVDAERPRAVDGNGDEAEPAAYSGGGESQQAGR